MRYSIKLFSYIIILLLLLSCESTIEVESKEIKAAEKFEKTEVKDTIAGPNPPEEPVSGAATPAELQPTVVPVDLEKPYVIEITSTNKNVHLLGEQITLEVKFNEPIFIDDQSKPKLSFELAGKYYYLSFVGKLDPSTLQFQSEEITEGMNAYNGITLNNKIINPFSIKDSDQNIANEEFEVPDLSFVSISTPWVRQFGLNNPIVEGIANDGNDTCNLIHIDKDGSLICLALTNKAIAEPNAAQDQDIMIIKFNENGDVIWTKQFGDTTLPNSNGDQHSNVILSDDQGNLYVSGYTTGYFTEPNAGGLDIFFYKLDSEGNILWKTQFGTTTTFVTGGNAGSQVVTGMDFDSLGQIVFVGYTQGAFTEPYGGGYFDFIMGSVNPNNGSANWMKHYGANTPLGSYDNSQYLIPSGLKIDKFDNRFIGYYTHQGSVAEANGGSTDVGFIKMDKNQNIVWIKQYGASTTLVDGGINTGGEFGGISHMDTEGNLYFSGSTSGSFISAKGGSYDFYCGAINQNGDTIWAKQLGDDFNTSDTSVAGSEYGGGLIPNSQGEFVITFLLDGSNFAEAHAGVYDIGIIKLNKDGTMIGIKHFGATTKFMDNADHSKDDNLNMKAYDKHDAAYLVGYTAGSVADTNAGGKDILLLKIDKRFNFPSEK